MKTALELSLHEMLHKKIRSFVRRYQQLNTNLEWFF